MAEKLFTEINYEKFFVKNYSSDQAKSESGKEIRRQFLELSDWSQVGDVPQAIKDAYAPYRQALRDLPTHPNWPNITKSDWPTEPDI